MRTERWCSIVKDFNLISLEYSNSKIQEFIKFSTNLDKNNTKACANSFYKKNNLKNFVLNLHSTHITRARKPA